MSFKFRLWPTIFTLVMMAIVIGLGTWQVQRLAWKTELLATMAARTNADPVNLPPVIADPKDWAFRRVHAAGHFADDKALWLYGRTFDGKAGIHLLVPLVQDDGSAILVDRGFVPFDHGSTLVPFTTPQGQVEIDGVVRQPEPAGWFVPAAKPDQNIWYAVDPAAMSQATGFALLPVYIAAKPQAGQDWPKGTGGNESLGIRNEHLNYAIFWYSMAAVLAVIYILSSRTKRT
jgi:surfeit locus 1 family protein